MRGKRDCERLENSVGSSAVHTRKLPNNLKTRPDQQTNEYVENGRVVSGRNGGSGRGSSSGGLSYDTIRMRFTMFKIYITIDIYLIYLTRATCS